MNSIKILNTHLSNLKILVCIDYYLEKNTVSIYNWGQKKNIAIKDGILDKIKWDKKSACAFDHSL